MTEYPTERCRRLEPLLSAWLDQSLPRGQRQAIERHLAACAHCRAEVEALRRTVALLRSVPRRTMPAELHAALAAALGGVAGPRSSASGRATALRVAAALLLLWGLLGASAWILGDERVAAPVPVPLDLFVSEHQEPASQLASPAPVYVELREPADR